MPWQPMQNRRMHRKFSRIYREACKPGRMIPYEYEQDKDRFVIFSDHHKGDGSAADDFRKNGSLYDHALSFYWKEGYRLVVLGDNEELWENSFDTILLRYRKIIEKEIAMAPQNPEKKKIRIWGNHDKEVSLRRFQRYCESHDESIFNTTDYREGLCLGKDIFLIHGHQGRFFEDKAWRVSRWAVQFVWKCIQKLFNIGIDGPAENFRISDSLERQYYAWAKKQGILLICGHTHRAIFGSLTHFDRLQEDIQNLKAQHKNLPEKEKEHMKKKITAKEGELRAILRSRLGIKPMSFEDSPVKSVPCYFNAGCCGYTNGITCLEIDRGSIRLIKWNRKDKSRSIFVKGNVQKILFQIQTQNS